jgi:hypothetical protein
MFTVDYDEAAGVVRCSCQGFLTLEDVQHYEMQVQDAVARCRRKEGDVRMLVLSLDAVVQSVEVAERARAGMSWMTSPHDRLAVVVASSLARLQADRMFESTRQRAFVSEVAAMEWLLADRRHGRDTAEPA